MSGAVLLGFSFRWETGEGRLNGSGLGREAGSVRLTIYAEERQRTFGGFGDVVRRWPGPSVEMHATDVAVWQDDLIQFQVPETFLRSMEGFRAKAAEEVRMVNPHGTLFDAYMVTCEVRTTAGEVLNYPEMEPRKRKPDRGKSAP